MTSLHFAATVALMASPSPQAAVYDVVSRLAVTRGWSDHSKIHRATGIDRGTLTRWRDGGGGRTDWFERFEDAYPLPRGTLLDVYKKRRTPDEVVEAHAHPPEFTAVDYRAGAEGSGAPSAAESEAARLDQLREAVATAHAIVGRTLGRLGLDDATAEVSRPPDFLVQTRSEETIAIEVRIDPARSVTSKGVEDLLGHKLRWSTEGIDRMVVFTIYDWPPEVVDDLKRFGIEYAGSQEQLEQLLRGSST